MSVKTISKPLHKYNKEIPTNDIIFRSSNNFNTNIRHIQEDRDFNSPDKKQFIFSTHDTESYVVHSNNLITPIRYKPSLRDSHVSSIFDKENRPDIGIFVIDYYNYYKNSSSNMDNVIQYYLDGYGDNSLDIDIRSIISNELQLIPGNNLPAEIKIRIISYVPITELHKHKYIYLPTSGILVCSGNLRDVVAHPVNNPDIIPTDITANISIDIVDNDNNIIPYYVKIGNEVHKLFSRKDVTKENGCRLTIDKNGVKSLTNNIEIKSLKSVGIYTSTEEALTEGDIGKYSELRKIELEHSKLKHQYDMMTLEMSHYKDKHHMDMHKKVIDTTLMVGKHNMELEHLAIKMNNEIIKSAYEFILANKKLVSEKIKHHTEIGKYKLDRNIKILTMLGAFGLKLIK